jgi:hypothetical protein
MGDRRLTPKSEAIERFLYVVRGERVLFDADLAALYGVSTSALNQAVKRNRNRFPADFMFRMKEREWSALKSWIAKAQSSGSMMSQVVTSSRRKRTAAPYAFTEQGVAIARKIEAMERKYDENSSSCSTRSSGSSQTTTREKRVQVAALASSPDTQLP